MSWPDIKATPRIELEGLMTAFTEYNEIHSFDGYSADEVGQLAKDKPYLRGKYNEAMNLKAKYEIRSGTKEAKTSFKGLLG